MNIEERISRLERESRTRRWIVLGLALVVGAFLGCYAISCVRTPDTVRAKNLEIVNDEGRTVASLAATKSGAWLGFSTTDGTRSLGMGAYGSGLTGLVLHDKGGTLFVTSGGLSVSDEDGGVMVTSGSVMVGRADLAKRLRPKESAQQGIPVGDEEREAYTETPLVVIGRTDAPGGLIEVYNPLGKVVVSAQCNKANEGAVSIHDVNGKFSNVLGVRP